MISRPDLSVELREKRRSKRRRMKRRRGRAVVALNTGIILHRLTLSLHIMFKLAPGNVRRERERDGGGLEGAEGQI